MQSNITARAVSLVKHTSLGHVYQVRNHVKMYPWRRLRNVRESYLDNRKTPYTDKHNINEFKFTKARLKPWMEVTCKDKENRFNKYAWNENYTSDPKEAKATATSRFGRFQQSLKDRGDPRERAPYQPPDNVMEKIASIYREVASHSSPSTSNDLTTRQDVLTVNLNREKSLKFNFITRCIGEFEHHMPSSYLNDIETINDIVEYFSTEVRGVNPYDSLVDKKELPPNLSVLSEPDRFNKETDTIFKGISALPGQVSRVPGLRARKKYPILNQDEFQWPDI